MDTSNNSEQLVGELRDTLEQLRDADAAVAMAAYMRDQFTFFGVRSPERRAAAKPTVAQLKGASADDLLAFADLCFAQTERDFHYIGADALNRHERVLGIEHLDAVADLITTKSWWDSVDQIAPNALGRLALREPDAWGVIDCWIDDDNFWLARSALIHQLKYKERTDPDVLFDRCLRRAEDGEFFIRKAIGWALRQYAYVDPNAVADFVSRNDDVLSNLSIREATKHLK